MSHNITVEGGTSVRLTTAGKYCDRDIVVTATGGTEDLNEVLTEQETLIATLQETLNGKAAGGGGGAAPAIEPLEITENGTYTAPDGVDGYSPVTVNVPIPNGYIKPSGAINITENGTYDVAEKASAVVSIPEREIVLQDKTIEANGTYSADEGYDGLGQVTVNVPSSGGGEDLNALLAKQEGLIATLQETLSHKMADRDSDLPEGYYRVDFIEFNGE